MLKSHLREIKTTVLFQVQQREKELDQLIRPIHSAQSESDRISAEVVEKTG
jgi:hypothetical protein